MAADSKTRVLIKIHDVIIIILVLIITIIIIPTEEQVNELGKICNPMEKNNNDVNNFSQSLN